MSLALSFLRLPLLLLLALALPAIALAQAATGAPAFDLGAFLLGLLQNEQLLLVVVGAVVWLYRLLRKDKAAKEVAAFDLAVKLAYDGVRNFAALQLPGAPKLDKVEKGLELFSRALHTELGRTPTQAELASAAMHFDAAHASEAEMKAWRREVEANGKGLQVGEVAQSSPSNVLVPTTPLVGP